MSAKLFTGELMTCRECGARKLSNPKIESGWTAIEIVDPPRRIIYICPKCWNEATKGAKK